MIAHCSKCGNTFFDNTVQLRGGVFELFGNFGPNCSNPSCDEIAPYLPGFYHADNTGEVVRILSGPSFTFEILERLRILTVIAKSENYSIKKFEKAIEKKVPEASKILKFLPKDFKDIMEVIKWLTPIITVAIFKCCSPSPTGEALPHPITVNIDKIENNAVKIGEGDRKSRVFSKGTNYTAPKKKRKKKSRGR